MLVPIAFAVFVKIFLPEPVFNTPVCLVVEDRNEQLLGATIAGDGQWRFPYNPVIPEKFQQASICFEDKRFYLHFGVDPIAVGRAMMQNLRSNKRVSGGSTITMQVVRLARNKPRNIIQKSIEMVLAIYVDLVYSKDEILALYAWQAPFGGNVVGLEAAAWRYFGRKPEQLSWGEAAALAVLPNSPALIHPGRNRKWLQLKRDFLLDKLRDNGTIDSLTCRISKLESLPEKPLPLPQLAPQLTDRIFFDHFNPKKSGMAKFVTTIDAGLQQQVNDILKRHSAAWIANGIHNGAAVVIDVETGEALAYAGNISDDKKAHHNEVDVIVAPRSPGSTLKPLLFSAMLTDGLLLPTTLIPDIPTQIAGYAPKNFNLDYDGAVAARKALSRSLNVPAIRMLRTYGVERFHLLLQRMGMTTINQPASHYGLSLILGGGEISLWELSGIYASMARMLNNYHGNSGRYDKNDWHAPQYLPINEPIRKEQNIFKLDETFFLNAGTIWSTFEAMEEVMRPGEEAIWKDLNITQKIAWKTGTSYGFRDGWAIGCTPKYVVGVWVGNADGEGRPGLTGIATAAPVMFEIFAQLPECNWFDMPYDDLEKVVVCSESGFRALDICEQKDTVWIPRSGMKTPPCPYHQLIHLDATGKYRVHSECESTANMIHKSWFVLPPAMEWYYKTKNQHYKVLPDFRADCVQNNITDTDMEIIYPKQTTTIYVPVEIDGTPGKTIFEVAHRNPSTIIYWHLDDQYLGSTRNFHQMALYPAAGKHLLYLIDENGGRLEQYFEVIGKE
jgi:penicillin-binding protein 1C